MAPIESARLADMFAPIDFSRVESALASPAGWIELLIVGACFGVGWLLDRRVRLESTSEAALVQVGLSGVNRVLLPLTTLVLLLVVQAIIRHWHPPFFIAIALPLAVALAVIRLLVFTVRRLFGTPSWLSASERAISFTIWGLVLLYFTGVLPGLRDELSDLEIPVGSKHLSVYELLRGAIAVVLTVAVTLWLSGLLERRLMRATGIDTNLRAVLGKFIRAILLVAGVLFGLQAAGIDLTLLAVFGGALGVGIGLGLQKLASNYIAGFTILLDRSIRLGDMITVDNRYGMVAKVTARYVVVRSLDGIEAIVPNETLATTTVLNHSYSSREVRIGIPIQISYDSDVDRALQLMVDAACAEPRALRGANAPQAFVVRFGDSGLDLELGLWINDPENGQLNVKSEINRRIWKAFAGEDIRIPFPQREIRIVGANDAAAGPAAVPAPPPSRAEPTPMQ
jgi:small-conductance mechanosensitive channel